MASDTIERTLKTALSAGSRAPSDKAVPINGKSGSSVPYYLPFMGPSAHNAIQTKQGYCVEGPLFRNYQDNSRNAQWCTLIPRESRRAFCISYDTQRAF
jgi:hypothetical protein